MCMMCCRPRCGQDEGTIAVVILACVCMQMSRSCGLAQTLSFFPTSLIALYSIGPITSSMSTHLASHPLGFNPPAYPPAPLPPLPP